ncbi:tetraacyldisaccharide 4'-kinase [Dyadobacter sandarakinus]|uniref:Tetraacyldisaccharide 4'-kinase n=1 Tax=Dyadobacter sandarakinus TaxID=2747268 RepID=A0ABX7I377_9BACT|nr:tetraacyldisaccharide 4'-kinase [Dyadobacter sandarakinus]QRQ99687.1 tetraacyldisaccharide 4'-kinase [Dyadobacter sandarakinus]
MNEQNGLKALLAPLNSLYGGIMAARSQAYSTGLLRSVRVLQTVISIGNLTVGGTGKTPVTEYLAHLLSARRKVAILSRGYGRSSRGFVLASSTSTAADIGDEPLQYFTKFGNSVAVAVCENRVEGAHILHDQFPEHSLLLLDDAYQHLAIRRDINLLLNDYNRPFYKDAPFPGGRLRESRRAAKRADAVIVTKCPENLDNSERASITERLHRYTQAGTPIFFSSTAYQGALDFNNQPVALKNVKMVAGIANPAPFAAHLARSFVVEDRLVFPDHHNYTAGEVLAMIQNLKKGTFVVTTEKDMVKLKPLAEQLGLTGQFAYIPVSVCFGHDSERFNEWIFKQIGTRAVR